jgi:N-hydroxyarylamine O-acetyltransferase
MDIPAYLERIHYRGSAEPTIATLRAFRILDTGKGDCVMQRRDPGAEWKEQYRFTLQPRQLADFTLMCRYHQTSLESIFTRKRICTRMTPTGRVTLSDMRLISTENGQRCERALRTPNEYQDALQTHFGIVVST